MNCSDTAPRHGIAFDQDGPGLKKELYAGVFVISQSRHLIHQSVKKLISCSCKLGNYTVFIADHFSERRL